MSKFSYLLTFFALLLLQASLAHANTEVIVNKDNVSEFEDLLVAPLVTWIQDGSFSIRVASDVDFNWQYGSEWRQNSKKILGSISLDEVANLNKQPEQRALGGFPFGFSEDLDLERDLERKAQKILWNISYASARDQLYSTEMVWLGQRGVLRKARGRIIRSYFLNPQKIQVNDAEESLWKENTPFSGEQDVFFKEMIQFFDPPVVFGFAHLTHRFRGSNEDAVWLYSPVIGSSRKLLETNRGDGLFGSSISPTDLFIWSSKPQGYRAVVEEEKTLLVPFSNFKPVPAVYEDVIAEESLANSEQALTVRGRFQQLDGSETMMIFNQQSRAFPGGAAWIPTQVVFIPRQVWIIELLPKDPFRLTGREVLIVDKESMLPVYRIVFDRVGDYEKTVLGTWAMAEFNGEGSKPTSYPFSEFILSVSGRSSVVLALTTSHMRSFENTKKEFRNQLSTLFDIATHEQLAKKGAEPSINKEAGDDFEEADLDF